MDRLNLERARKIKEAESTSRNVRLYLIIVYTMILVTSLRSLPNGPDGLMTEIAGEDLALIDYFMDIFMPLAAGLIVYGLYRRTKWTYPLVVVYSTLMVIGEAAGTYILFDNIDRIPRMLELAAMERGRDLTDISTEQFMEAAVIFTALKILVYLTTTILAYKAHSKIREGAEEAEKMSKGLG